MRVGVSEFYAPELHVLGGQEAKAGLERIAKGRRVECIAQHPSYDRVVAYCTLQGVSLGIRMRAAGVREGGNWR